MLRPPEISMPRCLFETEEHELPLIEGMLACTLALMTGYSQALQADLHPAQRLPMGLRISDSLSALATQPMLSPGFQQVLEGLQRRWSAMAACTLHSAPGCGAVLDRSNTSGAAHDYPPRMTLGVSKLLH
jgi:hypothetical protein